MKNRKISLAVAILSGISLLVAGCGKTEQSYTDRESEIVEADEESGTSKSEDMDTIIPTSEIASLEDGLADVQYSGYYGFSEFLNQGGASSDSEVMEFLTEHLFSGMSGLMYSGDVFGCSTISVKSSEGKYLFGRNFDWNQCDALVVSYEPEGHDSGEYASLSTVNMDFIAAGAGMDVEQFPDRMKTIAALYAPLDGMNEKGLCVSVNMIQDSATIEQNTDKPDITTTTAVRLLLNQAADVEEALSLLKQYDLHASMGMMIHFALADAGGRSVVVEYIGNEMVVTDTPVVTNFYLAPGEKNGIGTEQSHTRYEILTERLKEKETMDMQDVRDALDSVSKDNFGEFESTEWSIVYNQDSGVVQYYHRENYEKAYSFQVPAKG
ncbi:MAG: linear amide C-N hydrolase [Lachnospiraceae bacterium]|nr:linear amide C-N hydrolase [Lachnospiraceae bacterium]